MIFKDESEPWDGFLAPSPAAGIAIDPGEFRGKRVLITGAGGYIGSALARALSQFSLDRLVLLDHAEHGLYQLEQDLQETASAPAPIYVVGSVLYEALVRELFARNRFNVVFHAAALKHVPLMERNPLAAIETNVFGMRTVAAAAAQYEAERLLLLSTDKAVEPISILGASKRLAEMIVLANDSATRMTAVRLCNVLGSTGSVAPHFVRQIQRGEPVTVTHPEATRYFLSLRDTVQVLLAAATQAVAAKLVIPRLTLPTRITDLAQFLISERKNTVIYTQLRPGDKLHESMTSAQETVCPCADDTPLLIVDGPCVNAASLDDLLLRQREYLQRRDAQAAVLTLRQAVQQGSFL